MSSQTEQNKVRNVLLIFNDLLSESVDSSNIPIVQRSAARLTVYEIIRSIEQFLLALHTNTVPVSQNTVEPAIFVQPVEVAGEPRVQVPATSAQPGPGMQSSRPLSCEGVEEGEDAFGVSKHFRVPGQSHKVGRPRKMEKDIREKRKMSPEIVLSQAKRILQIYHFPCLHCDKRRLTGKEIIVPEVVPCPSPTVPMLDYNTLINVVDDGGETLSSGQEECVDENALLCTPHHETSYGINNLVFIIFIFCLYFNLISRPLMDFVAAISKAAYLIWRSWRPNSANLLRPSIICRRFPLPVLKLLRGCWRCAPRTSSTASKRCCRATPCGLLASRGTLSSGRKKNYLRGSGCMAIFNDIRKGLY